ncbi:MAG: hypothetical protein ACYDDF_06220 [Thermoplasmatota archaeon]
MGTTVRVRDDDKALIVALQTRLRLASGKRVPLEDLVHRIVEFAASHEDEWLVPDEAPKLSEAQFRAFFRGASRSAVPTTEEDIDEILYGVEDTA